jgi:hypothetical protein
VPYIMQTTRMEPAPGRALASKIASDDLAARMARAESDGVSLVGPGGLRSSLVAGEHGRRLFGLPYVIYEYVRPMVG